MLDLSHAAQPQRGGSSHSLALSRAATAALIVAATLTGCSRGDAVIDAERLQPLAGLEALIGSDSAQRYGTQDGAGSIGRVIAARVTPDTRHVAIVDFSPPYLRVFDRTGRVTHQAVERGGGPTELRGAVSLAATDDRALVLGPEGLLVAPLSPTAAPARVQLPTRLTDVATDCGGRLLGYGPDAGGSQPSFVHVLSVDTAASIVASLYPDARPQRVSFGHGRAGITGGSNGSTVVHGPTGAVKLIFVDCSGAVQERHWAWAVPRFPSQKTATAPREERRGDAIALTIEAGEPVFAGAGELPDGSLLWLESRLMSRPRGDGSHERTPLTDFYLTDQAGTHGGQVTGAFSLLDISPAGVLLSAREPFPSAVLVPLAELSAAIRQGRAFPRPRGQ
jgi:hypothetical protein